MQRGYSHKGFTLIEFILYIGLAAVVLVLVGMVSLDIFFGRAKLGTIEEVTENTGFALRRVVTAIESADSINSPLAGFSSNSLLLAMSDPGKNPTRIETVDGRLKIQEGAGPILDLTSSLLTVSELKFFNISYPSTPGTIRIKMALKYKNPSNRQEYNFEKAFYTTSNLRKRP